MSYHMGDKLTHFFVSQKVKIEQNFVSTSYMEATSNL